MLDTTTRLRVLALAAKLVGLPLAESHPVSQRALAAYEDVLAAEDKLSVPAGERARWADRLFVWSYYESSWLANPPGSNDDGRACGVLQVHVGELPPGVLPPKWTCARVREDRVLGYEAGALLMRHLIVKCGSVEAGLTAYATDGACHTYVLPLARRRIQLAGE